MSLRSPSAGATATTTLLVSVSVFLVATGNVTFWDQLNQAYPWPDNLGFLASVAVVTTAITVFALALFSLLVPVRVTLTVALVLAATIGYFTDRFGVILSPGMIDNALQTTWQEASELLSLQLLLRLLLLGAAPATLLWLVRYRRPPLPRHLASLTLVAGASLIAAVLCMVPLSGQYASFFREHKTVRYYVNPLYPLYATGLAITDAATARSDRFRHLTLDARVPDSDSHRELVVLVVGETARADHFSLNGYPRETNPRLARLGRIVSYRNMTSCGTSTAVSLPCMFSFSPRKQFDADDAPDAENVLDTLTRAGVDILWRDNNTGTKGVADRVRHENFRDPAVNADCADGECRDTGMLAGLQAYVDGTDGDVLIVLHQMGSHGPAYYRRYPERFERFTPACRSAELSECSDQEIVNAYDNSIVFTDHFIAETIGFLEANSEAFETALLYVSDHGESLGEGGLYLHGMPYAFAPASQTRVAGLLWVGENSDIDFERTLELADRPISHDALALGLLALFEVDARFAEPVAAQSPLFLLRPDA